MYESWKSRKYGICYLIVPKMALYQFFPGPTLILLDYNRMLNPCNEVNKLQHYGNKYSRLFNKGECFIRKL